MNIDLIQENVEKQIEKRLSTVIAKIKKYEKVELINLLLEMDTTERYFLFSNVKYLSENNNLDTLEEILHLYEYYILDDGELVALKQTNLKKWKHNHNKYEMFLSGDRKTKRKYVEIKLIDNEKDLIEVIKHNLKVAENKKRNMSNLKEKIF